MGDEALKKKIEAKNSYEHYIYSIRNTTEDDKLKDAFEEADKTMILDQVKEHQAWLDSNQDASAEEYESRYKDLEKLFQPIMTKVYQKTGGGQQGGMPGGMGGMPGGMGGMGGGMPGGPAPQQQPNANVED